MEVTETGASLGVNKGWTTGILQYFVYILTVVLVDLQMSTATVT